jgi:predicted nucleic acid-binding protein
VASFFAATSAVISVITASELLVGVHRAADPLLQDRRRAFVDSILDQFAAVPIDLRVAREHSRLTAKLLNAGTPNGTHDSWIAATTRAYGHALVTANAGEFKRVEGLVVIEIEA